MQTLAGGLRAGQKFIQTLDSAAQEMGDPFRTELLRTLRELELGVSVEDAFEGLRERIADDDFDLVVDAVLIQRQVGVNLAEVLTNIAHTIRERIRIRGEVNALTGQARLSGWVLGLLPVAVGFLVYMMNPRLHDADAHPSDGDRGDGRCRHLRSVRHARDSARSRM